MGLFEEGKKLELFLADLSLRRLSGGL